MCFSKSAAGFWWTYLFFSTSVPVHHAAGRDTSAALRGFAPCRETDYEFMSASMEMVRQATWNGVDVTGRLKHMHVGTGSYTYWI